MHLKNENYIVTIPDTFDPDTGELLVAGQSRKASNKNVCTDLELTGDFWKMYSEYYDYFVRVFEIDTSRKKSVSRLDYCMDIAGLDTNDCFKRFRRQIAE